MNCLPARPQKTRLLSLARRTRDPDTLPGQLEAESAERWLPAKNWQASAAGGTGGASAAEPAERRLPEEPAERRLPEEPAGVGAEEPAERWLPARTGGASAAGGTGGASAASGTGGASAAGGELVERRLPAELAERWLPGNWGALAASGTGGASGCGGMAEVGCREPAERRLPDSRMDRGVGEDVIICGDLPAASS
jgi:hypothetical protein